MKGSRKFQDKVKALKKINKMPDAEAQAIAKRSRLIRLKSKRVILRGPTNEIIGTMLIMDGKLRFQTAEGVQHEAGNDGCILLHLPPPPEKKKAKAADGEAEKKVKKKPKKPVDAGAKEK